MSAMELTLGRLFVAFRILPAGQRATGWRRRREGPPGESGFARLLHLRRDHEHVSSLDDRLLRDVGLYPADIERIVASRRIELVLWAGLHG
jgi:hypothetical protein